MKLFWFSAIVLGCLCTWIGVIYSVVHLWRWIA